MKQLRKGIAIFLLLALFICNSLSVAAASLPPAAQAAEPSAGQSAQPLAAPTPIPPIIETNQSTTIEASVSPAASYYVVIPDRVSLGTLPAQGDFTQFYTVQVTMPEKEDGRITVSSQDRVDLALSERAASTLPCHNQFGTRHFTKSGSAEGQLTILGEDIRAAKPGTYSGVLQFHIRYEHGKPSDLSDPGNQTKPTTPNPPVTPTEPPVEPPVEPPADIPTDPIAPPSGSGKPGSGETYYSATVSMRKDTDFNSLSMCNALFYRKADIVCKGDTATMTLYVINPVPKFASEGTPLSKISMTYRGKSYPTQLSGSKVAKHFDAAPGFIETAGNYNASPIVIQLPMQAIREASGKAIRCTAYVNAIMKQNVGFYVVLKDLVQTGSAPSNQDASAADTGTNSANGIDGESATLTMGQGEKTYYESKVSMRRSDDFKTASMCNSLFHEKADIVYQGDTAELTLYVIDPVPKFADEGTPLSDVAFLYEGKKYAAALHPDKQVKKHFEEAPGFIPASGEYSVTPVSVVLPKEAIEASLDAKLMCSAYINTVMHTTQKFYVVLDDLKKTDKPNQAKDPQKDSSPLPKPTDSKAPESEAVSQPEVLRITTKLFPRVLGYVLFTSLIVGVSFVLIWYRRKGKDVFHGEA